MAVFRVEKNKGYTVMSNHHLRNKELSLKAKRKIKYRYIKYPFHSFPFPKSLSLRGRGTAVGTEAKGSDRRI